jgi:prepilin-type N-terminal cleavage/methylation domain-containing protein
MRSARRSGMTLIELVMVMGLIALMLGFGVGAIASLDIGTYGSGSLVRSTLRSAGNWSRARQAPARVRFDPETGRISAEGLAVIGTWHFEQVPPKGAFGLDGRLLDAELVDDGFVGKALSFSNAPGASYEVPVHTDPAFSLKSGFQLQVVLRPEGTRGGPLVQLGGSLKLEATSRFGLRVSMETQRYDPETGKPKPSGSHAQLETPAGVLQADSWNRVLVTYDQARLRIFIEGLEVARLDEEGEVTPVTSKMVLGGGQRPWSGSMDSLVINAVGGEQDAVLPRGVSFAPDTPREIVFDGNGGLDRAQHEEPLVIELLFDDGRRDTIRVNLYGTVE